MLIEKVDGFTYLFDRFSLLIFGHHVHPFLTTMYPSSDGYNAPCHKVYCITRFTSTVTRSQTSRGPLGWNGRMTSWMRSRQQLPDAIMAIWTKISEEHHEIELLYTHAQWVCIKAEFDVIFFMLLVGERCIFLGCTGPLRVFFQMGGDSYGNGCLVLTIDCGEWVFSFQSSLSSFLIFINRDTRTSSDWGMTSSYLLFSFKQFE